MGRKSIDITGIKFGKITPIRVAGLKNKHSMWECRCECGNVFVTSGKSIRAGESKSCGCFRKESMSKRTTTHGHTKKGHRKPSEYYAWHAMKDRCYREKHPDFHRYGGRGINVCNEWINNFDVFLLDMGSKPTKSHSIDRIDNDKGYCKENCRWATAIEQNNNRSNNVWIEYNGRKKTAAEWSKIISITPGNFGVMMKRKKSIENIFKFYEQKRNRIFSY